MSIWTVLAIASGWLSLAGGETLNITDFGAKGDATTLNTSAIQKAIDACHRGGGGAVLVPAGRFLTGSLELEDNVVHHPAHNAVLLGSTDPDGRCLRPRRGNTFAALLETIAVYVTYTKENNVQDPTDE